MFSPLARMQAIVKREMVRVWVEYMPETVAMRGATAYGGWITHGPDVRVRVVLKVRGQAGVDGVCGGW